ncbi:dynein light chain LC8-type [Angomonas deanei]|uniref:Dynein light chain n=1 Tax=Angomonas deanei TaxID=59799 RepID=S9UD28_9TRYP|nr:dynein light chain LC8-type [Angomonas deanei]EPY40543.1 dynein light chain LC8-type [Angomonas deanei]CAD2217571.1 Dynein light chain type 1, putative [Angomonas deanei]|eukprot:EPY26604.1 dynein light chain LC8-type [Angomonas deanei]
MPHDTAVIHDSAMGWDMQQDCVDCAVYALATLPKKVVPHDPQRPVHGGTTIDYSISLPDQNTIAKFMKNELDSKYGPCWHVVVGHSYGSLVGHVEDHCIYFSIEDIFFLLWRMDKDYESVGVDVRELQLSQQVKRDAMKQYY